MESLSERRENKEVEKESEKERELEKGGEGKMERQDHYLADFQPKHH